VGARYEFVGMEDVRKMPVQVRPLGSDSPGSRVVRITGRYRLPSDVVGELRHVLAENPLVVVLDLDEVAGSSQALFDVFEPVASYLAAWPGTVMVVCAADPAKSARLLPPTIIDRVVLSRSWEEGLERARNLVPHQHRTTTFLQPHPQASDDGRSFVRRTLHDWRLEELTWSASLVVSELVTHSIVHADTALDLTLSRVDERIRIAVHDYGSDNLRITQLAAPTDPLEDPLRHRGLLLVRALTRCWGVFPSQDHGKTVWAVMEAA
jgi:anti-sigma regulatory factor (Ser/Thr protein kinase)